MIEDARGWKGTLVDKGRRGSSHFLSPPLISSPLLSLHHAGTYSTYFYSDAYCDCCPPKSFFELCITLFKQECVPLRQTHGKL